MKGYCLKIVLDCLQEQKHVDCYLKTILDNLKTKVIDSINLKRLVMIDIGSLKNHVYEVVGALWEVHHELGAGLNEACYQEAVEMELTERKILFTREYFFHPIYHGTLMKKGYSVDFLCKNNIVVECKAVDGLNATNRAQLFNYLRLLKAPAGILVNFALKNIELERYFYDKETQEIINVYGNVVHKYT